MSKRVWAYVLGTLVLAGALAVWSVNSGARPLRSQHAHPVVVPADGMVLVSAGGNLFHAPGCKDLHQPAQAMLASEAIAKGYAPCTRCMRKALGK